MAAVLLLLLGAAIAGAAALHFHCDDAYITFRYIANAHHGAGPVWNAAPFLPVEGYTSFAWVLLLWGIWSWFGVEPPVAAVVVSFTCGVLQFLLLARVLLTMRGADGQRAPVVLACCSLAAIVGSRSWLQWWSGGLETPLFVLCVVLWSVQAFRLQRPSSPRLAAWATTAAAIALARPDGLLFAAATAAAVGMLGWRRRVTWRTAVLGVAPLLLVVAHQVFRRVYYGEWLPNTYYAKVIGAWPESGLRYLASFAIEHGVWLWLSLAAVWVVGAFSRWRAGVVVQWPALAATAALVAHLGYYVLRVGGDLFEYRVFAHLVPLLLLAAQRMALDVARSTLLRVCWPIGLLVASGFGWVHFAVTRDMGQNGLFPIADRVPALLRPVARVHDRLQGWLHLHFVGLRCNQHALTLANQQRQLPARGTAQPAPGDVPVFAANAVGWVAWTLQDIAILDRHGLNDWVVGRTPIDVGDLQQWRQHLEPFLRAGDRNDDGWLDAEELQAVVFAVFGATGPRDRDGVAYAQSTVAQILFLCASQRGDALALDEIERVVPTLFGSRKMAHDHLPPAGYEQDYAPNVEVVDGEVRITPRQPPLSAERIAELEAGWRARVRGEGH